MTSVHPGRRKSVFKDDEVNFLKSIQKLRLIVYQAQVYWLNVQKQSIFHTGVATLQAIFRAVNQAYQNAVNRVLE